MTIETCIFRVDESSKTGKGHFTRCMTLATHLVSLGIPCVFVSRDVSQASRTQLQEEKIELLTFSLPDTISKKQEKELFDAETTWELIQHYSRAKPCALVVDSYNLGETWQKLLYDKVARLCVIDELDDRQYYCHMLVDQTYGKTADEVKVRCPSKTILCVGSQYGLVRKQFAELRDGSLQQRESAAKEVKKILITMGGSDAKNASSVFIKALQLHRQARDLCVTIVVGELCPHVDVIKLAFEQAEFAEKNLLINTPNMAQLMLETDICISAAGSTLLELATLGVPTLTLQTADNQRRFNESLTDDGAVIAMGHRHNADPQILYTLHLNKVLDGHVDLTQLSMRMAKVTDGRGVERVAQALLSNC